MVCGVQMWVAESLAGCGRPAANLRRSSSGKTSRARVGAVGAVHRSRPTVLAPWGSGVAWAGNNRSWARERRGSRPVPVRTGRMRSARGKGVRHHERAEDLHTGGAGRRAVLRRTGGWRRGAAGAEPAPGVAYASRVPGLVDAHRECCGLPAPGPVASGVARKSHICSPILRAARSTPAGHGHDQPRRMLTASLHRRRPLAPPASLR